MNTVVVWLLIAFISDGSSTVVVDNIATQQNCLALLHQVQVMRANRYAEGGCVAVRKVLVR